MLSRDELLRNIDELYESNSAAKERISQLESQNAELESRRARLITLNAALREGFAKQGEKLTALKADISQRDSDISALREQLNERGENISALQAQIAESRRAHEAEISKQDAHISIMGAELNKRGEIISSLQAKIAEDSQSHEAEILSLREKITAQDAEISQLRGQIAEGIPPGHIPALSPLEPEFLRIDDHDNTGGPDVANFWPGYFGHYPATGRNDRYKFYIGYLYERLGWRVTYRERDKRIFCIKGSKIIVVCTEDGVNISHNTMYALIGSALKCKMDNMNFDVSALCVTSRTLTQGADIAAKIFSVARKIHFPFANFPYVKCKVLSDGKRVCYTPLNEQYFTAQIDTANGDSFCLTVDDAVQKGFRSV